MAVTFTETYNTPEEAKREAEKRLNGLNCTKIKDSLFFSHNSDTFFHVCKPRKDRRNLGYISYTSIVNNGINKNRWGRPLESLFCSNCLDVWEKEEYSSIIKKTDVLSELNKLTGKK